MLIGEEAEPNPRKIPGHGHPNHTGRSARGLGALTCVGYRGRARPEPPAAESGRALSRLSRGDRDVLLLTALADLSQDEIAQALNIPCGTVRSRLHRARRKLRQALPDISAAPVAFAMVDRSLRDVIIVDPAAYRFLGSYECKAGTYIGSVALLAGGIVDKPGQRPGPARARFP